MTASSILTRIAAVLLVAVLPFALTGCGDSHEKAAGDMVSLMNRLADTLDTVKDKASAEAAKDKLKAIGTEMKEMKARMDKLGKPSEAKEKELKEKYEKELTAATTRIMGASMKIAAAGPEAAEILKDVMNDMKTLGE